MRITETLNPVSVSSPNHGGGNCQSLCQLPDVSERPPDVSVWPPDVSMRPPDISMRPLYVSMRPPDEIQPPPAQEQHRDFSDVSGTSMVSFNDSISTPEEPALSLTVTSPDLNLNNNDVADPVHGNIILVVCSVVSCSCLYVVVYVVIFTAIQCSIAGCLCCDGNVGGYTPRFIPETMHSYFQYAWVETALFVIHVR